jgi:acyl dehydratase
MSLEHLVGRGYGPFRLRISPEKVAEYVAATGDDPDRWVEAAPPSYAGALLFTVAPALLQSDDVAGYTAVVIHADQVFRWHGPLTVGTGITVTGRVDRVRTLGGAIFVSFSAAVEGAVGVLLESAATFVLGSERDEDPIDERAEPDVGHQSGFDPLPGLGEDGWPAVTRSAGRADLVRYAAASGDFNPIHWDHAAAVRAGLPATVVHGLLMGAWLLQPPALAGEGADPLVTARLRFRQPLFAAEVALLAGTVSPDGTADLRLSRRGGVDLVTARVEMRGR